MKTDIKKLSNNEVFALMRTMAIEVGNLAADFKDVAIELENREYHRGVTNYVEREIPKSANQQRAEVIQRAREFVKVEMKGRQSSIFLPEDGAEIEFKGKILKVDYVVNAEKKRVIALFKGVNSNKVHFKGIAKCMPNNVFNESIGKAIALARALKIRIPRVFIDAVQPDGFAVGQIVSWGDSEVEHHKVTKIERDRARFVDINSGEHGFHWLSRVDDGTCAVIDDTNASYQFESVGE